MVNQQIFLPMIPDSAPIVINISQYDYDAAGYAGRLYFNLISNGTAYDMNGASAIFQGEKPDGTSFAYAGTIVNASVVRVNVRQQMTTVAGRVICNLVLNNSEGQIGSFNVWLEVQESATSGSTPSQTDIPALVAQAKQYADDAEQAAETAASYTGHPPYIGANNNWFVWDMDEEQFVDTEVEALGQGIVSITKTSTSGLVDTYTITYTGGDTATFTVTNGQDGTDGVGITSITKTATAGLVDTYTITFTDGNSTTFDVTNGTAPDITATATADALSSATPTVTVTKGGTALNPTFAFAFSGLKGQQGEQGATGQTGATGATGNGIASIEKTGTSGLVDTYTITYTNGQTTTFTVTNGQDGTGTGDMLESVYDADGDVKNASSDGNGIKDYVANAISGKQDTLTAGTGISINSNTISLDMSMLKGSDLSYDNTTSELTATNVQDALDELAAEDDTINNVLATKAPLALLDDTVGWDCRNLTPNNCNATQTGSNVTYTRNSDKSVTISSSAASSAVTYFDLVNPAYAVSSYETIEHFPLLKKYQGKEVRISSGTNNANVRLTLAIKDSSNNVKLDIRTDGSGGTSNKGIIPTLASTDMVYFTIRLASGVNLTEAVTVKPMVCDSSLPEDIAYAPYHKPVSDVITDVYEVMGENGAKNVLPMTLDGIKSLNSGRTWTGNAMEYNGITYTINTNAGGAVTSISESGTATGFSFIRIASVKAMSGSYLLNKGISVNKFIYIQNETQSVQLAISNGEDASISLTPTNDTVNCIIGINPSQTGTDTFYPMLRLTSDPDDTYAPPAMTNQQLTQKTAFMLGYPSALRTVNDAASVSVKLSKKIYPLYSNGNSSYLVIAYKYTYGLPSGYIVAFMASQNASYKFKEIKSDNASDLSLDIATANDIDTITLTCTSAAYMNLAVYKIPLDYTGYDYLP